MSLTGIWDRLTGKPVPTQAPGPSVDNLPNTKFKKSLDDNHYSISDHQANWYQALPYGFRFTPRTGSQMIMMLPISPNNITVTTHFATNVIPTLYGTVEEHSPVRYYDIEIEGTTGITPHYYEPGQKKPTTGNHQAFSVEGQLVPEGLFGGFGAKTLAALNNVVRSASELISGKNKPETGIYTDQTGYVAFHNLYRFLLQYKRDVAGLEGTSPRSGHPLTFFNYKDNVQYNVVVRGFILRRSADNPMLYNYRISLRGFNMTDLNKSDSGPAIDTRLQALGLNGVNSSSLLNEFKQTCGQGRSILGSITNGINQLGR